LAGTEGDLRQEIGPNIIFGRWLKSWKIVLCRLSLHRPSRRRRVAMGLSVSGWRTSTRTASPISPSPTLIAARSVWGWETAAEILLRQPAVLPKGSPSAPAPAL